MKYGLNMEILMMSNDYVYIVEPAVLPNSPWLTKSVQKVILLLVRQWPWPKLELVIDQS